MGSIDQNDHRVKADRGECCPFVRGRREHHNLWLAQLQIRSLSTAVWFQKELLAEQQLASVDPARNIFLDLEDLAESHRDELTPSALEFAETFTNWAKSWGREHGRTLPPVSDFLTHSGSEEVALCA